MTRRALVLFIGRRLAVMVLLLVLLSFLVFSLLYLAPGNVVDILLGTKPRTPETVRFLTHEYHLDRPFFTQYWIWAKGASHFHFGNSIQTTLPVTDEIKSRLPTSLFLGVYATILTTIIGMALGIGSALRRRTPIDRGIVAMAIVGLSTPAFVSGVLLLYLFAVVIPWFPAFGRGSGFVDTLWHLTLPAVALTIASTGGLVKYTRAAMINAIDQDYVTFARARGLSGSRVLLRYVLRNALIPVITIVVTNFAFLITGVVFVEVTFSLPGIGGLFIQSVAGRDLPMIQGVSMLAAAMIMSANLLADLLYVAVDPRIRLGRQA
jgi:peptide/nickel transport system permease protein